MLNPIPGIPFPLTNIRTKPLTRLNLELTEIEYY